MKLRFLYRAFKAGLRDQRAEIHAARTVLRRGDTAVDVGANKGAYLFWLRRFVGAEGRVFAYEPQPRLAAYLEKARRTFGWQNVLVRNVGVSDRPGRATLHVPGAGDSPGASLEVAAVEGQTGQIYECELETLDRELADASRLTFLKVDVEGHELSVFRGAVETLRRFKPTLVFECEARHLSKHTMNDVFEFLRALGYTGRFFSPEGLRPLGEFDAARHQRQDSERFWDAPGYCNNFLFTPADSGRR